MYRDGEGSPILNCFASFLDFFFFFSLFFAAIAHLRISSRLALRRARKIHSQTDTDMAFGMGNPYAKEIRKLL